MAETAKDKAFRVHLMVCAGTACVSNHSFEIKEALEKEIQKQGLENEVLVVTTGCNGFCERGPLLVVQPGNIFYQQLAVKDVPHLVEEHLLKGRPVQKLMYTPPKEKTPIPVLSDIDFFKKQVLVALRNRGLIDPEKIDEYIARDGYAAAGKALTRMTPDQIIAEISNAGLRGRGGAGFPTGLKWQMVRKNVSSNGGGKYLICNGDEGDPGAFMDRSILEADPHSVIEGMVIGARAVGATQGFVYVRNEYPLAIKRMTIALEQARGYGLLGEDILGTGFDFDLKIVRGAGAFVCGEETALIASVEGRLGEPRTRPPYPAQSGLWGQPTGINNVETWANVPAIIARGAKWYASIGTPTSKGTKVFSLVGKINNTGLVEVPMGITLREIIFDIGGGIPGGKAFKAVQTGVLRVGASRRADGPAHRLREPERGRVDDGLGRHGRHGRGHVHGRRGPLLPVLHPRGIVRQVHALPGRHEGHARHPDPHHRGEGDRGDIPPRGPGPGHQGPALCGLVKTAPNPVLTTMRYFRNEYEAHIRDKKCPAHVCRQLNVYTIDEERCLNKGKGCDLCRRNCASEAIQGAKNEAHRIDQTKCIKCGVCFDVCNFGAVQVG
jgi:NADH:ubiquinone oxidoreductase subunit F (NADH-binding)/(2Fe-2S) ferredoxin/NAD-dependent dihydropyrimidine dehydrogenase PreA subunit